MIPERLHNPTVGLIPTTPLIEAGKRIAPFVSVPIATAHRFAATAAPDPELDPHGFLSNAYGSSSGSGAAVAANLCAVAIGTETNGSILCPASINGVVG